MAQPYSTLVYINLILSMTGHRKTTTLFKLKSSVMCKIFFLNKCNKTQHMSAEYSGNGIDLQRLQFTEYIINDKERKWALAQYSIYNERVNQWLF